MALLFLLLPVSRPAIAAPSISELAVRPGYFTPNGDGRTETAEVTFVPGGASDSVAVRVEVRRVLGEVLVDTPLPLGNVPSGVEILRTWSPGPIDEGTYRFDVLVAEGADSVWASANVVADTTAPVVSLGAIGPNPYDPASAPPNDLLVVPVTVVSDSTTATVVRVLAQGGASIDSLGVLAGSGSRQFQWDGQELSGSAAPTGRYTVRAVATDLAGNADTTALGITLDRDAPVLSGVADTLQTTSLPLVVSGLATDFDRVVSVTRSLDAGSTYVAVDSSSAPGASVTWSTAVDFPGATPGLFELRLRATDGVGHVTDGTHVIAFDAALPAPISSEVAGDGTVANGETVRIQTVWNLAGLDISANFAPLDLSYVSGAETVIEGPAATYWIEYRVSPSNPRRAEPKQIVITGSTGITAGRDTVTVVLDGGGPRGSELAAINRNRFDPEARETVTVAAERPSSVLRVDVHNLAGRLIRRLDGAGWVEWDGRGPQGEICGSGVYFLRVEIDGEVEVRRVAVLRGGSS